MHRSNFWHQESNVKLLVHRKFFSPS